MQRRSRFGTSLRLGFAGVALAASCAAACSNASDGAGPTGSGAAGGGGTSASTGTAGAGGDGGSTVVSCDAKAASCATAFGSLFTNSNGRADGTLVALVRPVDTQCALPNGTHVTLQLQMQNAVQRLVASVDGVAVMTKQAPLLGPAYAEGWHENVTLEYAPDLGVHSTDFTTVTMDDAVAFICAHMVVGAPVSVFAYSDGTSPSSAHQIHSNDGYPDGAIVVDPTSATPTYLLFRYTDQIF